MAGFKAALINEIEKLSKKKKGAVAVILSLIFIILGQLSVSSVRSGFGLRGTGSNEFPILVLSVLVNTLLPLFTALVTIDSFCGEYSQNTMKITLTRPISRFKFFTAKITAIMSFVLANLLFVMVFSLIAGAIFNSNSFTFVGILRIIISYLVSLLPMLVLSLVIILITNFIRSGVGVFFLSILIFIVFMAAGIFFTQYSGILFTSMIGWFNLWLIDSLPVAKLFREFLLMLSYVIILFTGSFYLFDKKEF